MKMRAGLIAIPFALGLGAGVLTAAQAFADDTDAAIPTAPVASAAVATSTPAKGPELSAWGREDDDGALESGAGAEPASPAPRQIHGEVSAGFGSGGYAGVSGVADIPVGESGDLVVAGSRDSFDSHRFRGSEQSLSVGLFLNGAASHAATCVLPASSAAPVMDADAPPAGCNPYGPPPAAWN